ncbi:MAG: hypothetical protein LBB42_00675, partial [Coriobacteriales bacterium]|nr:hypothetical protein [Coriobacteriales bacterium]
IATYRYSDYGETERTGDSTFANEIAYTGGIYDEDTTLYYLNARYYSPHDARFMTVDPICDGENHYVYCGSDPINNIDPSGLKAKTLEQKYKKFPKPKKNDPLKIRIKKNKVTINWYFYFDGSKNAKLRKRIKSGIESKWKGKSFEVKGVKKVKVTTKIHAGKEAENRSMLYVFNTQGRSYVSWTNGWRRSRPGDMVMCKGYYAGLNYSVSEFKLVAAHEFGHILGIKDGYVDAGSPGTKKTAKYDSIMCDQYGDRNKDRKKLNAQVQGNHDKLKATGKDVSMALKAYKANRAQKWK